MFEFSRDSLLNRLDSLASRDRKIFSALCTRRIMKGFLIYEKKNPNIVEIDIRESFDLACRYIYDEVNLPSGNEEIVDKLDKLIEEIENSSWSIEQASAEDAVAALYYTFQCINSSNSQDAVWSASRAYSAVDNHVCSTLDADKNDAASILSHPLIQRELSRQDRDVSDLQRNILGFEALLRRATIDAEDFLPWETSDF